MRYRYCAGFLAAIFYNVWIWECWLNPQLDPSESLVSEYANPIEPFSWLYRAGDIGAGILLAIVFLSIIFSPSPAEKLFTQGHYHLHQLVIWAGLIFALATIGDVFFPLNCRNEGSVIFTGECLTWSNIIHEITSTLSGLSAIIMIIACCLNMFFLGEEDFPKRKRYLFILMSLGILHLFSAGYAFLSIFIHMAIPGYMQRLSILVLSLWWMVYLQIWQSLKSR